MNREIQNAYWRVERYHSEICGICREFYDNQDRIYLVCRHSFHEECFTQYEESIPNYTPLTCPICRREIPRKREAEPQLQRFVMPIPAPRLYQPVPEMKTGKRIFPQKNKSNIIFG